MRLFLIAGSLAAAVAYVMVSGCSEVTVQSSWRTQDISIDGVGSEWGKRLVQIENTNTAVGVFNDQEALYLALVAWNQQTQVQIAGYGCVLWFEPDHGSAGTFGIHFPLGDLPLATQMSQTLSRSETLDFIKTLKANATMLELIDRNYRVLTRMTVEEAAAKGIQVSLGEYNGRLLLEARIPWLFDINGRGYKIAGGNNGIVKIDVQTPTESSRNVREPQTAESTVSQSPFIFTSPGSEQTVATEPDPFRFPVDFALRIRTASENE